jgi:signal transduction histidine kinase
MSRLIGCLDLHHTGEPVLVAERERIARELHQFTVHRLFGIGLKLQALSCRDDDPVVSGHLDQCVQELDLAISDLRELVFNLDARHV